MANSPPDNCFTNNSDTYISINSSFSLKPSSDLSLLFNQFNNSSSDQKNDPVYVVNSNYYDIDQIQTLKFSQKKQIVIRITHKYLRTNTNFDGLQHLLKCKNKVFNIVAVSETWIMKKSSLTSNFIFNNYFFEFTPTGSTAVGTLLYIANHLSSKSLNELKLCKANQLESTFIEIKNSKKLILLLDVLINILL